MGGGVTLVGESKDLVVLLTLDMALEVAKELLNSGHRRDGMMVGRKQVKAREDQTGPKGEFTAHAIQTDSGRAMQHVRLERRSLVTLVAVEAQPRDSLASCCQDYWPPGCVAFE